MLSLQPMESCMHVAEGRCLLCPLGSSSWCFVHAYSTPSSCSWLSLPVSTTDAGRLSKRGYDVSGSWMWLQHEPR